jgi:hypothetical protein
MTLDDRAVKEKKGKIFGKGQKRDDLDQSLFFGDLTGVKL